MKKILFIVPSLRLAGAETQAVDLVNAIDPAFATKTLFTFEKDLSQLARVDRGQIEVLNVPRKSRFDLSMCDHIARLIDERGIDLVHCTMQFALLMGWIGARRSRKRPPLVCAIHITRNKDLKTELQDVLLYQWLLRSCRKLIFVCDAQRRHWLGKFHGLKRAAEVVHNGVDLQHFDADRLRPEGACFRQQHGIPASATVFCCVAGFRSEKGHAHLLRAFSEVLRQQPQSWLVLAGDGPARAEAQAIVHERGMASRVLFTGALSDVRALLAAANVKVLASTAVETFSVAMLEAMAMGLPVISTDIGGAAEAVIDGRTGLLVPCADEEALARAMLELVADPERTAVWGAAARALVAERYTREGMVERTMDVLREAMRA
ncbi:glycosyltransferase [Noviherbaspirillum pedocola]|uniref:Glycosyltransferase n=1 Tax=Noviherbaspirillum pedocola TaxID=2801341 RepID=A0A934WA13_9BURK|nr:glycosyltransferase [Noviherbaspirillum pedocola]MBK4739033.1 glycosyltransferase [Noviherbaspirillum pedocola]